MARAKNDLGEEYDDYRKCIVCGGEYSEFETMDHNRFYFGHPYSYGDGSGWHCLACWLGVGPLDLPEAYSLTVQAIVSLGSKTADGQLVVAVKPVWDVLLRLVKADPDALLTLPPLKLEELIAASYERRGFDRVTLTPRSADLGRDVIAEKDGWGSVRIVDQVKAYKRGHRVTAEEVRALGFVMLADQSASKGVVTTTSEFAPRIGEDKLLKPFLGTRIELIDGKELASRLVQLIDSSG